MDLLFSPLYLSMTPLAYLSRLSHQFQILLHSKIRDPSHPRVRYNKYMQVSLPSDVSFTDDKWGSFQYLEWRFTAKWNHDECKRRSDAWSQKHFRCPSNFIATKGTVDSYVKKVTRKKPSTVVKNHTHLIVYFDNALIAFMDHFFCDGLVLADFIKHMFAEERLGGKIFPKYVSVPLISDYMALEFSARTMFESITYPSQIGGMSDKTRTMTETITKRVDMAHIPWNRWSIYAHGLYRIFQAVPEVEYLRVGLTVGFDSDQTFGNNRIGMVIVVIQRPRGVSTYNEHILHLMEQVKTQAVSRSTDANTSYDIIRAYDIGFIRKYNMKRVIDIFFTSICFKEELTHHVTGIGGFIGSIEKNEFLYISCLTFGTVAFFTYVSNWKQINYNTLTRNGATINYEFDNQDPAQF